MSCRPSDKLSYTSLIWLWRGQCTKLGAMEKAKSSVVPTLQRTAPPATTSISTTSQQDIHLCPLQFQHSAAGVSPQRPSPTCPMYFLTPLKCAIFDAAMPFPNRSITWLMKLSIWGRVPMPLSACSTNYMRSPGPSTTVPYKLEQDHAIKCLHRMCITRSTWLPSFRFSMLRITKTIIHV